MILSRTIRLFLDSIGRSEEYEYYFRKFQSTDSASFAVLCPDYDSLDRARESFVFQLHYLLRMELYPTVLLCGPRAPEEADRLEAATGALFDVFRFPVDPASPPPEREELLRRSYAAAREQGSLPLAVVPAALPRAAQALWPERLLFVRMRGELEKESGGKLLHFLERRPVAVTWEDRAVLDLGRNLLRSMPGLHIAITSPANILKEIFTVKGAGTVIQSGHEIVATTRVADVDRARLLALIEESFGRPLTRTTFLDEITHYYLEAEYRGAVLLVERPDGYYLSKFAVGKGARGAGVAQELWEEVRARHPVLYWRSRGDNSINRWYARLADGQQKAGPWTVFWVGAPPEMLPGIIAYCRERPADFESQ